MKLPLPAAVRLLTRARGKPPPVPFGLLEWTPSAADTVLLLESTEDDDALVPRQIPDAASLPACARIYVLGATASPAGVLARLLSSRRSVPRVVRCTALLGRGYVDIGAGIDVASGADVAWGAVPNHARGSLEPQSR